MEKKKYPIGFYLITVIAPFLLFALLEVGLRLGGYGEPAPAFVPLPGSDGKLLFLNPDLTRRYFKGAAFVPHSINDVFAAEKDHNTLRIFILGESSAAGFPYEPNGSFSRFLNLKLKLLYPNKKFEVVNLGIAAINSYAILDILDEVIEQKPDLVLVYTGHNEFYGALGAASMTSIGDSPGATRFILAMNKLRVMQLISSLFSSGDTPPAAPGLMESLAKDKLVPKTSALYTAGIDQFRYNFSEIFSGLKDAGIPVIAGTLVSNLLDQPPFYPELSGAGEAYKKGKDLFASGKYREALDYLLLAKDSDELRFRAPSEFNTIIRKVSEEHGALVVAVDSAFAAASNGGAVGNDLMTDHLHPNLKGYSLMADAFLSGISAKGMINESPAIQPGSIKLDSLTAIHFPFSSLDSAIAFYRLAGITSQWPFNRSGKKIELEAIREPANFIDSLAIQSARGEINWDAAHTKAAERFIALEDVASVEKEYRVLISQFHYIPKFYDALANAMLEMKEYGKATEILKESYAVKPDAFSTKWLGILALNDGKAEDAKRWLLESLNYKGDDAQTLYNLSGAFITLNDYASAKTYIQRCIQADPKFPGAAQIAAQLQNLR